MTTDAQSGSPALEVARGVARVGSHVVRERLSRPKPARTATDLPVSRPEISSDWLTAVLCSKHPGAAVDSFRIDDASSGTTSRWRIDVTYNDAGAAAELPTKLFAKATKGFTQRLTLDLAHVLEGEPGFFGTLRPTLDIEAAHGYHGASDLRSGRSISLMEDISVTRGATFCTPQTSISRQQIEDLLAGMAVWHGHYWNAPELTGLSWLKSPGDHFRNFDRLLGMKKRAKVGIRRAPEIIPAELREIQDTLYDACERSLDIAGQGPQTLLHGDSHIGNTYVTADGRMGFTDWQVVLRGSWAFDVTYTMTSGLATEDRRAWERDLIAFYLERLTEAGGDAPDFETAWLSYRQQSLYPYFAWMITIGRSVIQPKFQPDEVCREIVSRTATALLDLDALGAVGENG